MATYEQCMAAASIPPSKRTPAQQQLVNEGSGYQNVRNADFHAAQADRRH